MRDCRTTIYCPKQRDRDGDGCGHGPTGPETHLQVRFFDLLVASREILINILLLLFGLRSRPLRRGTIHAFQVFLGISVSITVDRTPQQRRRQQTSQPDRQTDRDPSTVRVLQQVWQVRQHFGLTPRTQGTVHKRFLTDRSPNSQKSAPRNRFLQRHKKRVVHFSEPPREASLQPRCAFEPTVGLLLGSASVWDSVWIWLVLIRHKSFKAVFAGRL